MDNVWEALALGIIGGMTCLAVMIYILLWSREKKK